MKYTPPPHTHPPQRPSMSFDAMTDLSMSPAAHSMADRERRLEHDLREAAGGAMTYE